MYAHTCLCNHAGTHGFGYTMYTNTRVEKVHEMIIIINASIVMNKKKQAIYKRRKKNYIFKKKKILTPLNGETIFEFGIYLIVRCSHSI